MVVIRSILVALCSRVSVLASDAYLALRSHFTPDFSSPAPEHYSFTQIRLYKCRCIYSHLDNGAIHSRCDTVTQMI